MIPFSLLKVLLSSPPVFTLLIGVLIIAANDSEGHPLLPTASAVPEKTAPSDVDAETAPLLVARQSCGADTLPALAGFIFQDLEIPA